MELTSEQISFIRQDIIDRGLTMDDLADSLVDHICCSIENDNSDDFQIAYKKAIGIFGNDGMKKIQHDTILILTLKKEMTMKKTMYFIGYVATLFISTGLLFKIQQWPGAAIVLTLGIVLLNFAFLPMYFYRKYKQAV